MSDEHLPAPVEPTPLVLIQQALTSGMKPADLRELFELQRDHAKDQAERSYADAVTAFQAECPPIHKSQAVKNKSGVKSYGYAPFEKIMAAIIPLLRKHGIVVTFDTAADGAAMLVTCRVRVGVVEKLTTVQLPVAPPNPMQNVTQAAAGAISAGKRLALCAALNVVCTDEDTDWQAADDQPALISKAEEDSLANLLTVAGMNSQGALERFLDYAEKVQGGRIENLSQITTDSLPKLLAQLNRKIAAKKAAKPEGGEVA